MSGQQEIESGEEQHDLAESKLVGLGRGEVSDDNQLLPFGGNISSELLEAIKESRGNFFKFDFNSTIEHHITNVSGDVVKGNITTIKDSNIRKVGDGDEIYSERQDQSETSEYQQDINEGDQIEEGYGTYGQQSRSRRGISSGGARRKIKQKFAETQEPLMFDSDSQTDKIQIRTAGIQTYKEVTFNTEIQTDDTVKRDRWLQTDSKTVLEMDTQTNSSINKIYGGHQTTTEQIDKHSQSEIKLFSDNDVQTEGLELLTNETQTEIKLYQDDEIQTEQIQTVDSLTQTSSANTETMLDIHSVIKDAFQELSNKKKDETELKIMKLYNDEGSDLSDLQPLVTLTWKTIQLKIITKSLERHLTDGKKVNSILANTCLKLISQLDESNEDELISDYIARVNEVDNLGENFREQMESIHAVVAFYAAAKLHKLRNKGNESVDGIAKCVEQIRRVVRSELRQLQKLVVNHVIPLMYDCVTELSNIKNANPDNVVENKAWCLFKIGLCYFHCNEHQQYAEVNVTATNVMYDHFEEKANRYIIYGLCLHDAGVGLDKMNKNERAVEYYKMALKAYEKVEDWMVGEGKNALIAIVERNLKNAQAKLRK